jgi:putative membrane protein
MKGLVRSLIINSLALVLLVEIFPGFKIHQGLKGVVIAGVTLTLINGLIKPILKILFLPLNLLTLGLFSWIISVLSFGLLFVVIPDVTIQPFDFRGMLISRPLGLIVAAFLVGLIKKFLSYFLED